MQGLNRSQKREFRQRQRARHIGGQEDAFEDWDQGQLADGISNMKVGGCGKGSVKDEDGW